MKNTNPALPGIVIEEDNEYGHIVEGTSASPAIPTTAGYFAPGCAILDLSTGTEYRNTGTLASPSWTNDDITGDTNYMGNSAKTSYNRLAGYTKVDYRPTGGGTNSYAFQVRHNIGSTSGAIISLDHEAHITATGTASLRGVQGVAVVDATYTNTGGTLIGTYGQVRVDGTSAGSGFYTGLYGLVEASSALTASHVCSAWLDSHQANTVTGSHELLYMTNNGAATMDQAIYIYGGDKITNLMELNTVSGMVSDTAETGGTSKKIKITIDGVTHYINAYTG